MALTADSKTTLFFECDKCHFKCCKKGDYTRHLSTQKHQRMEFRTNKPSITSNHESRCETCAKLYNSRSGLWSHLKKCKKLKEVESQPPLHVPPESEIKILTNLVLEVVKSNADLQKQMLEVCKNSASTINNNHSHNKTFNMQVFLNEQCKDAMNIMDFVNSMTLELSDLEDVGEVGYVEGISKIIIRKLNELDVCKRPIHCSDFKREIMYVKDMDVWSKENSTFDKIRKAIKYVTKKNGDLLIPWIQKYPSAMNIQHPHNDIYMRIMNQAMGGRESFVESENKIIKKISKAVQIDKYNKC
jgi:hypothetical protein